MKIPTLFLAILLSIPARCGDTVLYNMTIFDSKESILMEANLQQRFLGMATLSLSTNGGDRKPYHTIPSEIATVIRSAVHDALIDDFAIHPGQLLDASKAADKVMVRLSIYNTEAGRIVTLSHKFPDALSASVYYQSVLSSIDVRLVDGVFKLR